ncbi:NTP transferase domain-containing protein [Patescibacteria group bacterium]|nr:NTP transferase domain-containing protein [Patescibacteria group bacterium]MBU1931648.1 NTP transferase domain-containing protein [Patescibacteria group bacterium]
MATTSDILKNLYVVILCGGGGTRLWPRSRQKTPKQFINFFSSKTLYEEAIENITGLVPPERILIITNKDYVDEIREESPEIPLKNIIAEPEKKNTALAMGVAAAYAYHRNPEAIVINIASDHLIQNEKLFQKTVLAAAEAVADGNHIATIGIKPAFPHTGLGYIHRGKVVDKCQGMPVYQALGFKEKPDLSTAKQFLKSGQYLWNANLYTWNAGFVLELFRQLAPDLAENIDRIYKAINTKQEGVVLKREYQRAKAEAIDYAISEKTDKLLVIAGEFDWCDVGDWKTVYELGKKGQLGNMVIQSRRAKPGRNVMFVNSKNNLVNYNNQLIALVGVEDLIVVDTDDALLICRRDQAQGVRQLVDTLKEFKKDKFL